MSTGIEWTDETWNPVTGCDRISAGCDHCYALSMAKRLKAMGSAKYQNDGDPRTSGPGFAVTIHPDSLTVPLAWREPKRVFVNSMSDLFHAKVPLTFLQDVFAVIAATPQHTYQVLTKRATRLARVADRLDWPRNLWMGVSVEDQEQAALRLPALGEVPAAVRWVSFEPLLGSVFVPGEWLERFIDWAVVGGESGPGARPMHPDWARSLRDQCVAAGVPYLFKQWGAFAPWRVAGHEGFGEWQFARVGKKAAGRELDGRTWDEYPAGAS